MSLEQIELADGYTPCPWCGTRPTVNEPWNVIRKQSTVWFRGCFDCALRHDDRLQVATDE